MAGSNRLWVVLGGQMIRRAQIESILDSRAGCRLPVGDV
jgi:hypothetical protein